jgi:hypothetical protein
MARVDISTIRPEASDEEVAAVLAAIEMSGPTAVVDQADDEPTRWRFSGRWWTKPIALRRDRPWQ